MYLLKKVLEVGELIVQYHKDIICWSEEEHLITSDVTTNNYPR